MARRKPTRKQKTKNKKLMNKIAWAVVIVAVALSIVFFAIRNTAINPDYAPDWLYIGKDYACGTVKDVVCSAGGDESCGISSDPQRQFEWLHSPTSCYMEVMGYEQIEGKQIGDTQLFTTTKLNFVDNCEISGDYRNVREGRDRDGDGVIDSYVTYTKRLTRVMDFGTAKVCFSTNNDAQSRYDDVFNTPPKICEDNDIKCVEENQNICENNRWVDKGKVDGFCGYTTSIPTPIPTPIPRICDEGQERCDGQKLDVCENNKYMSQGLVDGKCGYTDTPIAPPTDYTKIMAGLGIGLVLLVIVGVVVKSKSKGKKRRNK